MGVLTDGKLYNVRGRWLHLRTKAFDSQDGIGLQWLARVGIATGVISGRLSPATAERARQCKMNTCTRATRESPSSMRSWRT